MKTYQFMLVVEGPDLQTPANQDALFEVGCSDATAGRVGSVQYLDFDREAESLADAVLAAAEAIESAIPGARVVHLAPDDLVTMSEIADRARRTRESVRLLISGRRGPGSFPTPATHFKSRNRLWMWSDVAAWLSGVDAEFAAREDDWPRNPEEAAFVTAFNAALRWRAATGRLPEGQRQRLSRLAR